MGRLCYLTQPSGSWSWCFRQNSLPVARQVWRAFCRPGTNFIAFWRGRGTKFDRRQGLSPGIQCWKTALAQHRGISYLGGRKLSWCRMFIACSCANPGAGVLSGPASGTVSCKKHDKQLTHIVRVSSFNFLSG